MYQILEIMPNGCARIADDNGGIPAIETGDHERAQKLLSIEDYAKVKSTWTPELVDFRKAQIAQMEHEQAMMFI